MNLVPPVSITLKNYVHVKAAYRKNYRKIVLKNYDGINVDTFYKSFSLPL